MLKVFFSYKLTTTHDKHNILWREMKADWRKFYHGASFFIVALPKNENMFSAFEIFPFFTTVERGRRKARERKCKPVYDVPISCFYIYSLVCNHIMYILGGRYVEFFHFPEGHEGTEISILENLSRKTFPLSFVHFFNASGIFMCACFAIFNGNLYLMLPGEKDYFSAFLPHPFTSFFNSTSRAKLNYFMKEWSGGEEGKVWKLLYNET